MTALASVDLVLGSTSRYRRELLARLTPQFRVVAPEVNEMPLQDEAPDAIAMRLAQAKAHDVAARAPKALVIGSDQVAELDHCTLGKPGDVATAVAQLNACSGKEVVFHTAICLIDGRGSPAGAWTALDTTRVRFRTLEAEEIARYVKREQPLDCAGSFKSEGLGVALFEAIESSDPTALIGLPLVALCRLLRAAGIDVV